MKMTKFKMDEKQYKSIKGLNDKDFGKLMKAVCEYVFFGQLTDTKDKLLNLYFDHFKERIDKDKFFAEAGRLGGIKCFENRQKEQNGLSASLEVFKGGCLDEVIEDIISSMEEDLEKEEKDEGNKLKK